MSLLGMKGKKKWIVVYPDGKKSEPMDKATAKSYVTMFGGKIEKAKKE